MAEKHARILGELAEFGLELARKLHDQAMAAETPAETAALAKAFHSISRSVRQTIALEAKLAQAGDRHDREFRGEHERAVKARGVQRLAQVRKAVKRAVWSEHEGDEAEMLLDDLDMLLHEEIVGESFAEETIDAQISRICADLGLEGRPPPARPPDGRPGPMDGSGQGPP